MRISGSMGGAGTYRHDKRLAALCFITASFIAASFIAAACQTSGQPADTSQAPAKAEPTYLVVYRQGASWPADVAQPEPLREHFRYLLTLYRSGALRLAGPFGSERGGAAVFTASDDAAARAIIQADPAVKAQIFDFELRRWSVVDWAQHTSGQ